MRTISRIALAALLTGAVLAPSLPTVFAAEAELTPNAAASTVLDRGKADVVQLSGLRVTAVNQYRYQEGTTLTGTDLPIAVVTASGDPLCARYETEASVRPIPCRAIAARQYQIRVTDGTRLLDRNRKAIAIKDISVGDAVNVFGYADPGTGLIDARILRDTDQPAVARSVQLNDLRVIGTSETDKGLEFDAVRTADNCYAFQGSQRLAYPCPAGMVPADNVRSAQEAAATSFGIARYLGAHHVVVPKGAVVLDVNRRPLTAKSIQAGATVNVAGTMRGAAGDLVADVVRVTSANVARDLVLTATPAAPELRVGEEADIAVTAAGGSAPYSWTASGLPDGLSFRTDGINCDATGACSQPAIYCITAPCPQPSPSSGRIVGVPTSAGTFSATVAVKDGAGRTGRLALRITVADAIQDEAIEVRVETDRESYRPGDIVGIDVTATNITRRTQTRTFTSCQASYDVLPGFSLRSVQLCAAVVTELRLRPGQTETWHFDHDLAAHGLADDVARQDFTVVGRVEGIGQASTGITVRL